MFCRYFCFPVAHDWDLSCNFTFFPLKYSPPNRISSSFSGCALRDAFSLNTAHRTNHTSHTTATYSYTGQISRVPTHEGALLMCTWETEEDTPSRQPAFSSHPATETRQWEPRDPPAQKHTGNSIPLLHYMVSLEILQSHKINSRC